MVDNNNKKILSVQCPMENVVSSTVQSLDTVRALHHTVVSLRSALEEAKFEIQRLRKQISAQSDIEQGTVQEKIKLQKITNDIKFESKNEINDRKDQNQKLETNSFDNENTLKSIQIQEKSHIEDICNSQQQDNHLENKKHLENLKIRKSEHHNHNHHHQHHKNCHRIKTLKKILPDVSIITANHPSSSSETISINSKKMGSKIDVKIKVMSNIKVDGSNTTTSSSSSDNFSSSNSENTTEETSKNFNRDTTTKTAPASSASGGRIDGFHLKAKLEDKINIQKDPDDGIVVTHSSKDNLNVIADNDNNSQSDDDGDNSVFIENSVGEDSNENSSSLKQNKNSSKINSPAPPSLQTQNVQKDQQEENKEEVDDIELIFSSGETRDSIQEDLVSISEYDPWQQPGQSGTPVLVKFSSLPSSSSLSVEKNHHNGNGNGNVKNELRKGKLSNSTTCDVFLETQRKCTTGNKDTNLEKQVSFKSSSSLEKDNDLERQLSSSMISRDESLDFFNSNDYSLSGGINESKDSGISRKWTNYNVLVETDISKCGVVEETTTFEMMYRRNTCPNPPTYRLFTSRDYNSRQIPSSSKLTSKYLRRLQQQCYHQSPGQISRPTYYGTKRSNSTQTNITALPAQWKSESQLISDRYHSTGFCTLPSKFLTNTRIGCPKHFSRISESPQETRRVLLSDINFTSMVPELSRSADHLCQDENKTLSDTSDGGKQSPSYYKGNLLKTPDYIIKGMTPSASMTSPGVSQWTVNESSFGTQTMQTGESWGKKHNDSFDSYKSYSNDGGGSATSARYSATELNHRHRSRSVPSIRCMICKQTHYGIRTSESAHYTPKVTFIERGNKIRGSLPDLRNDCICSRRYCGSAKTIFPIIHGDSSGSTESLLDEADAFIRKSVDSAILTENNFNAIKKNCFRRMSENDIQRDYIPSKQSLPFLPKTANCLKPGHLAKVISKNGRVIVGRVRYVGPLATTATTTDTKNVNTSKTMIDDLYVGIQLQSKCGDCDGTYEGRKFFECEPQQGLFVPFKKVVMAWAC